MVRVKRMVQDQGNSFLEPQVPERARFATDGLESVDPPPPRARGGLVGGPGGAGYYNSRCKIQNTVWGKFSDKIQHKKLFWFYERGKHVKYSLKNNYLIIFTLKRNNK